MPEHVVRRGDDEPRPVAPQAPSHEQSRMAALAGLDLLTGESLPDVLARVASAAMSLLPASLGASVILWNPDRGSFTTAASTVPGQTGETSARRVRRKAGASRWIVDHLEPLIVPDVAADQRLDHNPMVTEYGIRAYAGLPLVAAGAPLGVLYTLDGAPRAYEASDIDFLQTLARRASSAIVNARLLADNARARDRAQALADVANALIAARSLDGALTAVIDAVVGGVRADEAAIYVIDLAEETVVHEIHRGVRTAAGPTSLRALLAGPAGKAIQAGVPERRRGPTGSTVVIPLSSEGTTVGVMAAHRDPGRGDLGADDVDLLEGIAAQATVAIKNARLDEATSAALRDVEALFAFSRSLGEAGNLEELLQGVVDGVAGHLPADRVALFGIDTEARRVTHAVRGGPGAAHVELDVSLDDLLAGLSGWALRHGRPAYSLKGTDDDREHPEARIRRLASETGSIIAVPLTHRGRAFGTLTVSNHMSQRDFTPHDVDVLASMASQAAVAIGDARLFEEVQRLAVTDGLTGIHNRTHLFELAEREFVAARRYNRPLAAVMMDLDNFKAVNDEHGHGAGDQVLVAVVERCRIAVREADLFGRYGGDELLLLLPETPGEEAALLAARLQRLVGAEPIVTAAGPVSITISAGLASLNADDAHLAELIDRADAALLTAKRTGRT